jgi:hypothetical protein
VSAITRTNFSAPKGGGDLDSVQMDALAVVYLDQPVLHGGRRATFLHMNRGEAIIRYWGDTHAVAVPPEALTFPPLKNAKRSGR